VSGGAVETRQKQHDLAAQYFNALAIAGAALAIFSPDVDMIGRVAALLVSAALHVAAQASVATRPIGE